MESGLKLWGLLTTSAIVLSNDSPTLVKAAARLAKVAFGSRIQICDGTDDHVEIQAAIDALPAAGGCVQLLDGTYNIEVLLTLDSNQTLRGCGRNTILTTSAADLTFLAAVGGSGTEKTGIVIEDLQIDGASAADHGIYFEYVDYSFIQNVYLRRHRYSKGGFDESAVYLHNSDSNRIANNVCRDNLWLGIVISSSNSNTITGNICRGNVTHGICLASSDDNTVSENICQGGGVDSSGILLISGDDNTISGNICQGNGHHGIHLDSSDNNTVCGNTCQGNDKNGIYLTGSDNNTIVGNTCIGNSQETDNAYADIYLDGASTYNNIQCNTCRAGAETNKPNYGIDISADTCVGNLVQNNDLYDDGFGTAPFNDVGTGTKLAVYVVPFVDGDDPQDSGFLIDLDTEFARTWLRLPDKVVQVVRMKVYARSAVLEADAMRAEFVIKGGADNEPFNTHDGSVANHPSTSGNFAADDVIFWTLVTIGVLALLGGDSVEVKVLHEAAGGDDCATEAYFRTVEIEYV